MQAELTQASLAELQQELLLAYEEANYKDRKDSSVAIELLQAYGAALAVEYFPELGISRSASLSEIAAAIKTASPKLRANNPNTWDFLARITERIGKHYGKQGKRVPSGQADGQGLDALLIPFSTPQKTARAEALKDRELHSVPSDVAYQLLREAIAFNRFTKSDSSPWPTAQLNDRNATGSARLIPLAAENSLLPAGEENKWVAVMWEQQAELSDLENDVLDALCTIWLHHARSENDDVLIDVDDLLKIRGLKPKPGGSGFRGGYAQEQRNDMLRAVSRVANLWVDVARRPHKKTSREEIIQSRAIVITDRKGQLRTDGYLDVESFIYRPGRIFSRYLLGPGRQTALLSSYALHYNPRTQPYEKRLVRYLSWQWRVRSATGLYCDPYSVQKLLDVSGIKIHPRKPGEAYERLERALDTLQENGVIASWQFVNWR